MRVQNISQNNYQNRNVGFKAHVHGVIDATCHCGKLTAYCEGAVAAILESKAVQEGLIKAENCALPFVVTKKDGIHVLFPDMAEDSFSKLKDLNRLRPIDNQNALNMVERGEIDATKLETLKLGGEDECPLTDPFQLARVFNIRLQNLPNALKQ